MKEIHVYKKEEFYREINFIVESYKKYERAFSGSASEAEKLAVAGFGEDCVSEDPEYTIGVYYFLVENMKSRVLMMFIDLIYQMFEQFIVKNINRSVDMLKDKQNKNKNWNLGSMREWFADCGCKIENLPGYEKVDELRLVSNTIKHGEGGSSSKLAKMYPDLINSARIYGSNGPLFCECLKVTDKHLKEYANAVCTLVESISEYCVRSV